MSQGSTTKQAVNIVLEAAKRAGAQTELIHLGDINLPIYDDREDATTYPEQVHEFIRKVTEADGLVIGSPEYHGNMTGAVKNAIDFLSGRILQGKAVAILGVAGGSMGATNTTNTLQMIMRNLHAWPLPSSPSVSSSYMAFDETGKLKDEKLQARFEALGTDLVDFVKRLT